ncbi:MAG: two-component system, sensor histidine kinase SagS [Candidatus Binataceae bacterium]|nr:two-component system, sensor histidine kinase SagS [Candidatus Binataceae bacterium]
MLTLDQKYLKTLIESSPDIIIAVDRDGTIIYYNDGARQTLRYSSAEIIEQKVDRIYSSLDEARRVMKAMRAAEGGRISNFETVLRDKDGLQIACAISGSIIYDDAHSEIGSIGFARDIRRMRQREQLATCGEIAVSLAHEINNPLETITNNIDLLARCVESRLCDAELVVETERLDSIRAGICRVQAIVRRLDEMTRRGVYETRDYLQGKKMADLAPRESPGNPAAPVNGHTVHDDWALSGMSVLVLDDDVSVVSSLADVLRAERCIVHTATRPSAALGVLRNMKVDAVISDVVMPEMDGYEFYMKVKEELPNLPVILMTAYYYDKDHIIKRSRLRGLEAALFKKPVNPAKLRAVLLQSRQKAKAAKIAAGQASLSGGPPTPPISAGPSAAAAAAPGPLTSTSTTRG